MATVRANERPVMSDEQILESLARMSECLRFVPLGREEWSEFSAAWKEARRVSQEVAELGIRARYIREAREQADDVLQKLQGEHVREMAAALTMIAPEYERFKDGSERILNSFQATSEGASRAAAEAMVRLQEVDQRLGEARRVLEQSDKEITAVGVRALEEIRTQASSQVEKAIERVAEATAIARDELNANMREGDAVARLLGARTHELRELRDGTVGLLQTLMQQAEQARAELATALEGVRVSVDALASAAETTREAGAASYAAREESERLKGKSEEAAERLCQLDVLGRQIEAQAKASIAHIGSFLDEHVSLAQESITDMGVKARDALGEQVNACEDLLGRLTNATGSGERLRESVDVSCRQLGELTVRSQNLARELAEVSNQVTRLNDAREQARRQADRLSPLLQQASGLVAEAGLVVGKIERLEQDCLGRILAAVKAGERHLQDGSQSFLSRLSLFFVLLSLLSLPALLLTLWHRSPSPSEAPAAAKDEIERQVKAEVMREQKEVRRLAQANIAKEVSDRLAKELPKAVEAALAQERNRRAAEPGAAPPKGSEVELRPEEALHRVNEEVVVALTVKSRKVNAGGLTLLNSRERFQDDQNFVIAIPEATAKTYELVHAKPLDLENVREIVVAGKVTLDPVRRRPQIKVEKQDQIRRLSP